MSPSQISELIKSLKSTIGIRTIKVTGRQKDVEALKSAIAEEIACQTIINKQEAESDFSDC